ncbi:MAG TPA: hypothetical protein VKB96_01485 [Gammaproteobacteria bacterium]|nr:hypothetical protein [Gammaproteobacteria bacterium]
MTKIEKCFALCEDVEHREQLTHTCDLRHFLKLGLGSQAVF